MTVTEKNKEDTLNWLNDMDILDAAELQGRADIANTLRAALQSTRKPPACEMPDENCKACEGYGVVATTKTDLDGYHVEAECPLCFPEPPVPVDTITIKREVLQGVRDALKFCESEIDRHGNTGSISLLTISEKNREILSTLDAVLSEGK